MQHKLIAFFTMLVLLSLLVTPAGSVNAQEPGPLGKKLPVNRTSYKPTSADANAGVLPNNTVQFVADPSFESAYGNTSNWAQYSTNFGTPLCILADCADGSGTAGPRTGSVWAWFGGVNFAEPGTVSPEEGLVYQHLPYVPACGATLQFYFWIGAAAPGSDANDSFTAMIDQNIVFTANATQENLYSTYKLVSIDVSAYANSWPTVKFQSKISGQLVTFNLDDVSLTTNCSYTISGNVGVGGATLSYTDGTVKSVVSQPDGSYLLGVSNNWGGTVTPTHPCYLFNPVSRSYGMVYYNLTGQNYTPIFNPTPACKVTTGVFRPGNGLLYLKNSNVSGFADAALNYGLPGDYPVTGDWDGDGDDTIGIYRNGSFYLKNANTLGFADIVFSFGQPGDQPVAGDWDGDGVDTIGVFHTSNGHFFLRNSNTEGPYEMDFYLGNPGDVGIAGDWNGDGKDTTGVFRPSNGVIFLKDTNDTGFADYALNYGLPGDMPVTGDWDGNGTDTIGIYRNGSFYLRNSNTNGFAEVIFGLGNPGDMPIAGNWDGLP